MCVCDRFLQEVIGLNSSAFQRSNIGFFFWLEVYRCVKVDLTSNVSLMIILSEGWERLVTKLTTTFNDKKMSLTALIIQQTSVIYFSRLSMSVTI